MALANFFLMKQEGTSPYCFYGINREYKRRNTETKKENKKEAKKDHQKLKPRPKIVSMLLDQGPNSF
jgi:hypothetical protein